MIRGAREQRNTATSLKHGLAATSGTHQQGEGEGAGTVDGDGSARDGVAVSRAAVNNNDGNTNGERPDSKLAAEVAASTNTTVAVTTERNGGGNGSCEPATGTSDGGPLSLLAPAPTKHAIGATTTSDPVDADDVNDNNNDDDVVSTPNETHYQDQAQRPALEQTQQRTKKGKGKGKGKGTRRRRSAALSARMAGLAIGQLMRGGEAAAPHAARGRGKGDGDADAATEVNGGVDGTKEVVATRPVVARKRRPRSVKKFSSFG